MRTAALVIALGCVVVAAALLLGGSGAGGRQAPALPSRALRGSSVSLAQLHGRPAVVSFFASWCEPCIREAPDVQRAYVRLAGRVALVAVDWSDGRGSALAFLRRFHWTMPVLEDPSGTVGDSYGLSGLPTTFVLDARGRIVRRLTGPLSAAALVAAARV